MKYEAKNYNSLIGIKGLSGNLLRNHFDLYKGYVKNINEILTQLSKSIKKGITQVEFSELKRRLGWEFNGMRLHEYYFGNLSKKPLELDKNSDLYNKIEEQFGTYEKWADEFKAIGAMRGIGWGVLCFDLESQELMSVWINEHDTGHLFCTLPLLVMDVFEHAFIIDYDLRKSDYIENFFRIINWEVVNKRFMKIKNENLLI